MGGMIYIWRIAFDCPESLVVTHDVDSVNPTLLRSGTRIDKPQTALFSYHGMRNMLCEQLYIPNSAQIPLVSVKIAIELRLLFEDTVQMIPAKISCLDGEVEAVLLNPLHSIAAADWTQSKALFIPGTKQVMKFTKLILLSESMGKLQLARLEEFRPFLLAGETIKALFSSCKLCEFNLASTIRP